MVEKQQHAQLHEQKFELLCYRTKQSALLAQLPFTCQQLEYVTPNGHSLSPKCMVKDLGVNLTSDYSWSCHINIMTNDARKMASWVL